MPEYTGNAGGDVAAGTCRPCSRPGLVLGRAAGLRRQASAFAARVVLFSAAAASSAAVLFILGFILRDALPFFKLRGFSEFLTSVKWFPSRSPPEFGALAIIAGSAIVTACAAAFAVPLGISAAVCMSEVLPFRTRQAVKPVIEILAAIPSVAYGFFALVVLAPFLQDNGGTALSAAVWVAGGPVAAIACVAAGGAASSLLPSRAGRAARWPLAGLFAAAAFIALRELSSAAEDLEISSGTNALNVSLILGIMALPTVVSVSEDALQAVGRDLREGSYALGATRAETVVKVVIPAASSGLVAAVMLGIMRAAGETMVVWMASGNSAKVPSPIYNLLEPIRTLTATIAGDMGEADHVTGSARYHALFAMAAGLLLVSFACNVASEWVMRRARRKNSGG